MERDPKNPNPSGNPGPGLTELDSQLLLEASENCDPAACARLLRQGAKVNARDEDGCTPLLWAVLAAKHEAVKLFLDAGAEVNCKNHDGETPLHWVAVTGEQPIARLLLERGAKINAKDIFGITPTRSAFLNGDDEMVELFRQHGGAE